MSIFLPFKKIGRYLEMMIAFAMCTGTRNQEFRLARLEDINLRNQIMYIENVKGADGYVEA